MVDDADVLPKGPWVGCSVVVPTRGQEFPVELPEGAVELVKAVGLPAEIEGMFYTGPDRLFESGARGGSRFYFLDANEKDLAGSYITRVPDGQVWNLPGDEEELLFCNSSLPLFMAFLAARKEFAFSCRDVDDDESVIKEGKKLKKRLKKLDRAAFKGDETWWSFVFEEVEDGILIPGGD